VTPESSKASRTRKEEKKPETAYREREKDETEGKN